MPPFLLPGGRVLVNGLVVGCEIVFKIVYEVYGLMENFFVFTAVHEERFRTEHFGNLGEDGRSAFGDEKVGKNTDGGIGGDARQAVGTAAFHADNQFAAGDGFALCRAGVVGQLLYQGEAVRDFVLRILGDKKFDAVRVVGADVFF